MEGRHGCNGSCVHMGGSLLSQYCAKCCSMWSLRLPPLQAREHDRQAATLLHIPSGRDQKQL